MDKQTIYLQTIREAYPDLDIHSARLHTSEGQFNDIIFINDDLIFRFLRYDESINNFLREIEVLQKLQGHLSLPIPHPIYVGSGIGSVGRVFMGYKLLPGKPLLKEALNQITDEATLELLAQQLANFLRGLHHLSPEALGLDLSVHDQLADSKTFFSNIQEHLFPFMHPEARALVTEHFENYLNNASLHEYEPSMIHGDIGGSNILFDRGKITGIIDFSFAGLGDRSRDIAAVSTYGDSFFARFCKYYSPREATLARARFHRGTFALYEALHGFRNNDPEAFRNGMEQYI